MAMLELLSCCLNGKTILLSRFSCQSDEVGPEYGHRFCYRKIHGLVRNDCKIERESQYEWAVRRVELLLPLVKEDAPEDDPARIELELLSELVSEYSEEHFTISRKLDIDAAIVLGV